MAIKHFVEAITSSKIQEPEGEEHVALLESAFNKANTGVYELGHKLSAGGRMSTSILAILVSENCIYAAKVGHGQAYLIRSGQSFPFFALEESGKVPQTLGTNSIVSVEIATVDLSAGDTIAIFSDELKEQDQNELANLATLLLPRFGVLDSEQAANKTANSGRGFAGRLDPSSCQRLAEQIFDSELLAFAAIMGIGSNLNFLPESCRISAPELAY